MKVATAVLQRKCACGKESKGEGPCAECSAKEKGVLQRYPNGSALTRSAGMAETFTPGNGTLAEFAFAPSLVGVPMQRKLEIGASNDPLEREADRIADQVMGRVASPTLSSRSPQIQRYSQHPDAGGGTVPASVDAVLAGPGRPMDPVLRQDMEQRFGYDFSGVRVHSDGAAERSARDVNAHAYTVGRNVVFGAGRFAPSTAAGQRLIAHELAHVVQSGAARPKSQLRAIGDPAQAVQPTWEGAAPLAHQGNESGTLRRQLGVGCCAQRGPMNFDIAGVFEHELIEFDYEKMHPSAERECSIPESTAKGNRGYADIVDPSLRQIFEIKPDNPAGVRQAAGEAWLYVEAATEFCGGVWKLGTNYFEHAIYSDGERQLWARLADPGAIVYSWRERKRSEALELVLLLLLAAALAAKKVAQNAGSKAGGPITAFIGLVAAAAVLVLGEREAKAGAQRTNDDPLVALAEVLTDTGRPMPPEIKALIDSDPQLRELVRLEMERRRRAGGGQAAQAQQAAADASQDKGGEGRGRAPTKDATGSVAENPKTGSAPAVLPPVAAAAGSSGTTSGKPSVDPKPVPSDQKATGLSPAIPTRPAQAQPPSSAAANSYLSSLQKMMNSFNWSLLGPDQAQVFWPQSKLEPKQKLAVPVYARNSGARSVFIMTVEIIERTEKSTKYRVVLCGPMAVCVPETADQDTCVAKEMPPAYSSGDEHTLLNISGD